MKKPIEPPVTFIETVKRVLEKKGITRDPEAELHRTIGRFIREGRTRQNLTLKQLARRTGLVGFAALANRTRRVVCVDLARSTASPLRCACA